MYGMFSATDSIDEARQEMFALIQVIWLTPTPQRKQLSFNILIISVLHTNQYAYGDKKLLYVKWKPKALRTGLEEARWHVANVLDSTSANCSELPTAYEVWLQDWMPCQVQVISL